jgi:hypothetical protein
LEWFAIKENFDYRIALEMIAIMADAPSWVGAATLDLRACGQLWRYSGHADQKALKRGDPTLA